MEAEGQRLRFQRPWFPPMERIERHFVKARQARWFSNTGPCGIELASQLTERTGRQCTLVASGTAGLFAALAAVLPERASRRTALLPSFTFAATAQAVVWAGLEPCLLDIDPEHWHLDPGALERAIERYQPAVVVAVSSFGTPPPVSVRERWQRACREADVPLIVDSAAGFGAEAEDGTPIGAQGDIEVVSFHATKPFAVGEGGAVFTKESGLAERLEELVNFGFDSDRRVKSQRGLNAKMSELTAATGLAVLEEFDVALQRRRTAAAALRDRVPDAGWQLGCERSTWQFVPICLRDRAAVIAAQAAAAGRVETRRYYEPVHHHPAFAAVQSDDLTVTEDLVKRHICLPMAQDLTAAEIELVGDVLSAAVAWSAGTNY